MRALCGAIISAGALIGLGLACIGVGYRYNAFPYLRDGQPQFVEFKHLDTALMFGFVVLGIALVIGLGIAFTGLAYHHFRRHHEMFGTHTKPSQPQDRISV
jgi:hypothetical protein